MKRFALLALLLVAGCVMPNVGGRVSKAPFKSPNGPAVLIVEDSSPQGRDALSSGQRAVLLSTAPGSVDDWCKTYCAKSDKGATEFAVVSRKTSMDKMSPVLQDAFAAYQKINPPPPLPFVLVANKSKGFSAALLPSASPEDVIAKLESVRK